MSDIVKDIKSGPPRMGCSSAEEHGFETIYWWRARAEEAAAEIEKLRAENDELKKQNDMPPKFFLSSEQSDAFDKSLMSAGNVMYIPEDEWMPIDSAPKDGTRFDVLIKGIDRVIDCHRDGVGTIFVEHNWPVVVAVLKNVTHWRPLPNAPK